MPTLTQPRLCQGQFPRLQVRKEQTTIHSQGERFFLDYPNLVLLLINRGYQEDRWLNTWKILCVPPSLGHCFTVLVFRSTAFTGRVTNAPIRIPDKNQKTAAARIRLSSNVSAGAAAIARISSNVTASCSSSLVFPSGSFQRI